MRIPVDGWCLQGTDPVQAQSEPVVIVFQTYRRTEYALRTIAAARENLQYSGPLFWYVADDGSSQEHMDAVLNALSGEHVIGWHSEHSCYGGNCNRAYDVVKEVTPLHLWLEDDWVLTKPVDITPHVALLIECDNIGMVRLGYLNTEVTGRSFGHHESIYWLLDRIPVEDRQLVFAGHPHLRHCRYWDAYGYYPVGVDPWETERAYARQFRGGHGPTIAWPADWPQWGHFQHIGDIKSESQS